MTGWPAHTAELRPWSTAPDARSRGGRRPPIEDRMLREITVSVPPSIADLDGDWGRDTRQALEEAQIITVRLDAIGGPHLAALSGFLLRSESIASSKIEHIDADLTDSAQALAGMEAGKEARQIASAADAVRALIETPTPLDADALFEAHRLLLGDDTAQADQLGHFRTVQNWIGGSDFTPRNADFVPPPPDLVAGLMADLLRFANRGDIGSIAQSAIVHAQFESIHPFADGNGRIGRALINTVLRHRGTTRHVVIPVASVMLADIDRYVGLLTVYRSGEVEPFVAYLAEAVVAASRAAQISAATLAELPDRWRDLARPRAASSAARLIEVLTSQPVVTVTTAMALTGTSRPATVSSLEQLEAAKVLTEITQAERDRVWVAHDVLDEMDRLSERIGHRRTGEPA